MDLDNTLNLLDEKSVPQMKNVDFYRTNYNLASKVLTTKAALKESTDCTNDNYTNN